MADGPQLSGFIDTGMGGSLDGIADARPGVNVVELNVGHSGDSAASYRLDFEMGADGVAVEQANVGYTFHADSSTALTFGVFNSPLGAELQDPTDRNFMSRSAMRTALVADNLTGLAVTSRPHSMVGVTAIAAANDTYALRLDLDFIEQLSLGLSGVNDVSGTTVDVDASVRAVDGLTIDVEYNQHLDAGNMGVYGAVNYDLSDNAGIAVRFDHLDMGGVSSQTVAIAPDCTLAEHVTFRLEWNMNVNTSDMGLGLQMLGHF